jgi:hypothetical protein
MISGSRDRCPAVRRFPNTKDRAKQRAWCCIQRAQDRQAFEQTRVYRRVGVLSIPVQLTVHSVCGQLDN